MQVRTVLPNTCAPSFSSWAVGTGRHADAEGHKLSSTKHHLSMVVLGVCALITTGVMVGYTPGRTCHKAMNMGTLWGVAFGIMLYHVVATVQYLHLLYRLEMAGVVLDEEACGCGRCGRCSLG